MRSAVVETLPKIAERGNAVAIKGVAELLVTEKIALQNELNVLIAAFDSLAKIAERGNAVAIKAVARRLATE